MGVRGEMRMRMRMLVEMGTYHTTQNVLCPTLTSLKITTPHQQLTEEHKVGGASLGPCAYACVWGVRELWRRENAMGNVGMCGSKKQQCKQTKTIISFVCIISCCVAA
jgi:hypothetical protein